MSEFSGFSQEPFEIVPYTAPAKEKVDFNSFPKISELVDKGGLSPVKLRELADQYTQAGIEIKQIPGFPVGFVELHTDGTISAKIPEIRAFGNDGVAVHEFTHLEQLTNGLKTLSPEQIGKSPDHIKAIAEVGALETQLKYLNGLPRNLKREPAYQQAISEATEKLEGHKKDLANTQFSESDKLSPYKLVVDL